MGRKGCDILEVDVALSRYAVAQAIELVGSCGLMFKTLLLSARTVIGKAGALQPCASSGV